MTDVILTKSRPASKIVQDVLQRLCSKSVHCLHIHTARVHHPHLAVGRRKLVVAMSRLLEQAAYVPPNAGLHLILHAPRLLVHRLVGVGAQPSATRIQPEVMARIDRKVHAVKHVGRLQNTVCAEAVATRFGLVMR